MYGNPEDGKLGPTLGPAHLGAHGPGVPHIHWHYVYGLRVLRMVVHILSKTVHVYGP